MSTEVVDDATVAVALADGLRSAGVGVATGQVVTCRAAFAEVDPDDLDDRYWAGRLTLLTDVADVPTYDHVFAAVTGAVGAPPAAASADGPADEPPAWVATVDAGSDRPGDGDGDELEVGTVAAAGERLRHRRFDRASEEELAAIWREIRRLELAVPHRRTRRTTPGRRGELDLARSLERALLTDGELVDPAWRTRRTRPRRLVLLLDVSGSMSGYARAMLRFAVAARGTAGHHRPVEVFAFGTRLTRLTDALAARDPDAAIAAAAAEVVDWDGGTRIGDSVDRLVRDFARSGTLRGAIVVVCSDGLERGDPERLGETMARLRRHVHRIVWCNPLAGDPRYEPTQRGMRAALPHVDVFLPGHDLASLEGLAAALTDLR